MPLTARVSDVASNEDHVVTAKEALEGLYLSLELETEARLVAAAVRAGWSAEEAIDAIDRLRAEDIRHWSRSLLSSWVTRHIARGVLFGALMVQFCGHGIGRDRRGRSRSVQP